MKTSYPRLRRVIWKPKWIASSDTDDFQGAITLAHAMIGRARTGWNGAQLITRRVDEPRRMR